MFKTPHMIVTLFRTYKIIQRLHKERNFNVKYEEELQQQIIDIVMQRKLSNDEIINEVMEMHTIELPLN